MKDQSCAGVNLRLPASLNVYGLHYAKEIHPDCKHHTSTAASPDSTTESSNTDHKQAQRIGCSVFTFIRMTAGRAAESQSSRDAMEHQGERQASVKLARSSLAGRSLSTGYFRMDSRFYSFPESEAQFSTVCATS